MQIKYFVTAVSTLITLHSVAAFPAVDANGVSLVEARAEAADQMSQHVSAIEAAAVQLQEAKVAFQAAKLEAAKAMINNIQNAHGAGHIQLEPSDIETAKDMVARAEQANQAEAAQAGQQGKETAQKAQSKACWPSCGGYGGSYYGGSYGGSYGAGYGGGYGGGYGSSNYGYGSSANLNVLGLLNVGAGSGGYGSSSYGY